MKNIFYNVIKSENQLSQLLVNLLVSNEKIKKVIQQFFFAGEESEIDSVHTQLRFEEGQPDIIFKFKNGARAITEVKTQDSTLTSNQPEGYVPLFLKDKNKFLIFLVPKYYKYENDITERFNKIENKEGIILKRLYWHDLIKEFRKLDIESDVVREVLTHLHEKFGYENIKFDPKEIKSMETSEIPKKILELNKAINCLAKSCGHKGLIWDNKIDEGYGSGYGFLYKNTIWFGYWFELWEEEKAALIITVNQNVIDEVIFNSFESFFQQYGEVKTYHSIYKFINVIDWDTEEIKNRIDEFTKQDLALIL